jgi:alkylation response protein AidB-like acyl-CoA dehydrogenase
MRIAYTAQQQALQAQLSSYFAQLVDAETQDALDVHDAAAMRRVVKQMSVDGWLGLGWPREFGGQERGLVDQFIFYDEALIADAPIPIIGVNLVGPTLMDVGTSEQKDRFLPRILSGDDYYCVGYSEPGAGTDLAALSTVARREGNTYVIDGTKTWTSYVSYATHCWLAVRTDPSKPRQKGLSVIIVPMDTPGVFVTPLNLFNDHDGGTIVFDSVRVRADNLIGEPDNGWRVITRQLNYERITMGAPGVFEWLYRAVRAWAAAVTLADGTTLLDVSWVRSHLARVYIAIQLMRLMSWSNIDDAANGLLKLENVSATKVYATEAGLSALNLLLEILGNVGPLSKGDKAAVLSGRVESLYRHYSHMTFGGGASEIQRELIASACYGIQRSR